MTYLDLLLGLAMVLTASGAFFSRDRLRAVVMFVAFGVLLALSWVRLSAIDLALAEAAIGAGLTGVLLLDAMGHLRNRSRRLQALPDSHREQPADLATRGGRNSHRRGPDTGRPEDGA